MENEETINSEIEKTKSEMLKKISTKEQAIFVVRAILWAACCVVGPVLFIAFRYQIFGGGQQKTSASFSGFGVIAILIILFFIICLFTYIHKIWKEWSFLHQMITGIVKIIIPLIAIVIVLNALKDDIDIFIKCLWVTTGFEFAAIPLNPFPEYIANKNNGEYKSAFSELVNNLADKLFNRAKEEQEKEKK